MPLFYNLLSCEHFPVTSWTTLAINCNDSLRVSICSGPVCTKLFTVTFLAVNFTVWTCRYICQGRLKRFMALFTSEALLMIEISLGFLMLSFKYFPITSDAAIISYMYLQVVLAFYLSRRPLESLDKWHRWHTAYGKRLKENILDIPCYPHQLVKYKNSINVPDISGMAERVDKKARMMKQYHPLLNPVCQISLSHHYPVILFNVFFWYRKT